MNKQISMEKVRLLYQQPAGTLFGSAVVVLAAAHTLREGNSALLLVLWATVAVVVVVGRYYVHRKLATKLSGKQVFNERKLGLFYAACALVTGMLWGFSLLFFFPEDRYNLSIIMVIHGGYISISILATSIYLPAFFAFVLSACLLITGSLIYHGGSEFWLMTGLSIFFTCMVLFFGIRNNRSVSDLIKLQLKNIDLLAAVEKERDRAQQAMLAKNRFLAAASHDLRQPVHALGLSVGSLRTHVSSPQALTIMDQIDESADGLSNLFHGLLDLSKLDANVVQNSPRHIQLDNLLSRLHKEFQSLADEKNLHLNMPGKTNLVALIDKNLLERVLRNLLSNAIKYTDAGSVTLNLRALPDAELLEISVVDTGPGIPPDEHSNIFSEYHQLSNPERNRAKGLGLGLAIVKRLCTLMEIPITVESTPGEGATFSIVMKAGKALAPAKKQTLEPVPDITENVILVVEDEIAILKSTEQLLQSWGCVVVCATSTEEAMEKLIDYPRLDAIVADFRLRDNKTGLESIQVVREFYEEKIPALLVTGDTEPARLNQASEAGVRMIHKPVSPERLKTEITQITDSLTATL